MYRSYGCSFISNLQFFTRKQLEELSSKGYFLVKQYPECELVNFASTRSKEEYYLGYFLDNQN